MFASAPLLVLLANFLNFSGGEIFRHSSRTLWFRTASELSDVDDERGLRYRRVQEAQQHLPGSRVACFPPKLHIGRFPRRRPRTPNLLSTVLRHVYAESPPYGHVNWFVWGHPRVLSFRVEPVLAPPSPFKGRT